MSRLMQIVTGFSLTIFLPIILVIALLFAALSAVEEAAACIPPDPDAGYGYPVKAKQPSQPFSDTLPIHYGVDFPAETDPDHPDRGEAVKAVKDGRVLEAGGGEIVIQHQSTGTPEGGPMDNETPSDEPVDDVKSVYKNLKNITVTEGARVTKGQKIAEVGTNTESTGAAGPVLHLEMHLNNPGEDERAIRDPMEFLEEINTSGGACSCGSATGALTGSDNQQKVFNFFVSKGYTKEQAAGIVGNMMAESGVNPKAQYPSTTASAQTASGMPNRAWGVVQWLPPSKMIDPSRAAGASWETIESLEHQVGFLWKQLEGTGPASEESAGDALKATTTVEDAAFTFGFRFERFTTDPNADEFDTRRANARGVYDRYAGSAPDPTGTPGQEDSGDGCTGTVININGTDYGFPLALPKSDVNNGYSWPCESICHHDGSPAFDLARKALDDSSAGTSVVAITNGRIENFNDSYAGIEGCHSFQLVGDDGWWYWYGHLQSASVRDGQQVTAGQPIAVIGERKCTGNGSYPHLHIDRGSPKGHYGGVDCCRDPGFVDLINQLYNALPA
jgi:murein DD-endopeptidase MepM/ murein hydrolase activator NlpD